MSTCRSFGAANEGEYTCSASINSVTSSSVSISLALLESEFDSSPVYVVSGSQIILTCGADSPSQLSYLPTIAWTDGLFFPLLFNHSILKVS